MWLVRLNSSLTECWLGMLNEADKCELSMQEIKQLLLLGNTLEYVNIGEC